MKIDADSDTWHAIDAWAADLLARACDELESPSTDPARAQYLRGRIKTLRRLRALTEPEQAMHPEDSDAFFGI